MSRSRRKPVSGVACAKPKTVAEWKITERRRERRFLNSNLEAGAEKVSNKKYQDSWDHPTDGVFWDADDPKLYRK